LPRGREVRERHRLEIASIPTPVCAVGIAPDNRADHSFDSAPESPPRLPTGGHLVEPPGTISSAVERQVERGERRASTPLGGVDTRSAPPQRGQTARNLEKNPRYLGCSIKFS